MPKLSKRAVDALCPSDSKDQFIWDSEVRGFGARMKPSGSASFLIQYRTESGATRRFVLGKVGTLAVDEARKLAKEKLALVAKGRDPSAERRLLRHSMTVADLCAQYLTAARAGLVVTRFRRKKRESTIQFDEGRVSRHIVPLIGGKKACELHRADVQGMADSITEGRTRGIFVTKPRGKAVVTGGAGTAARVVGLLGGIWTWAEKRGQVEGPNPAHGVETASGMPRERTLSVVELARLGTVLQEQRDLIPGQVALIRLLAFTGMRFAEGCSLEWDEIDPSGLCLRLRETKTGRSTRALSTAAAEVIASIAKNRSRWLFPNKANLAPADFKKSVAALFDKAQLSDARSQVLRRTFSSVAADEGYSDATVAELIGHARQGVTARHYIRLPDAALLDAANRVASRVKDALEGKLSEATIILMRRARAGKA